MSDHRHLREDVGLRGVAQDDVELLLEGGEEVRPVLAMGVDALQRLDRLVMLLLEVVQDVVVDLNRFLGAPEVDLEELTQPIVELDLVVRNFGGGDTLLQRVRQRFVRVVGVVDVVELGERVLVPVVDPEDEAICLLGAGHVAELLHEDAGQTLADVDPGLALRPVFEDVGVGVGELRPAVEDGSQALDLDLGVVVGRLLEERALHPAEGTDVIVRALLGDLADPLHHRDTLDRIGLIVELQLVDVEELAPVLTHPIKRLEDLPDHQRPNAVSEEELEARQRGTVLRRSRQDLPVLLDGVVHVAELSLIDLTQAELEVEDVVGARGDRDLLRQDVGELRPAIGRLVERSRASMAWMWVSSASTTIL